MKIKYCRALYCAVSFLTDCTNGFKPLARCKLALGTALVGLMAASSSSCKSNGADTRGAVCYDVVITGDGLATDTVAPPTPPPADTVPPPAPTPPDTLPRAACYDPVYIPDEHHPE